MNKTDTLNRTPFVDQVFSLIETISEHRGNTTFAIDGTWGCGKSFVLDMLEEKLNDVQEPETADNKFFVIRYNCWENDFYEEPLIAFVSAIMDNLPHLIKDENKRKGLLNLLKTFAIGLANIGNSVVKATLGVDPKSAIQPIVAATKAVKKNTKEQIQEAHAYDDYFTFKNKLSELHKILKDLAAEQTLIIIVDELDRCSPEYAIKVLERIHHITEDLPNTITIVATDKSKLKNTVDKIYGFDQNTNSASIYLKKFINFEIKLDNGINDENVLEKYKAFVEKFDNTEAGKKELSDFISLLFNNIPSREQEHLWEQAELVHNLLADTIYDKCVLATELVLVVYSNYYHCNLLDGVDTKNIHTPLGFQHNHKNLSKFEQGFARDSYLEIQSLVSSESYLRVTKQTGLYGQVLWNINNIKQRTNNSPSYLQLASEVDRNKFLLNSEFLLKFAGALKLIK